MPRFFPVTLNLFFYQFNANGLGNPHNPSKIMETKQPIRVLVFGSSGTGKTTLCNYLSGGNQPTNDSPLGATFETFVYPEFTIGEDSFILTDTVGLNESSNGTVKSSVAITNLVKLLKRSKEGYNLLVHVVKAGRLDNNTVANYELFIRTLTKESIPVIMVATHGDSLDDEKPMSSWATENKSAIEKTLGLRYKNIQVTSFKKSSKPALEELYAGYRNQSLAEAAVSLVTFSTMIPVLIYETRRDLEAVLMRCWNVFCDFIGVKSWRYQINKGIRVILKALGLDDSDIDDISRDFD